MQAAALDDAASVPSDQPTQAGAEAAWLLRRVGRWVRRLGRVGTGLTQRLGWIADSRDKTGPVEGGVDLQLGWALVSRAARWTRALRTRLRAMAMAVKPWGPLAGPDIPRRDARRVPLGPPGPAGPPRYGSTHCIEGMMTHEVVGQICADLAAASTLLQATKAGRVIARIEKAARALMAGPDATWRLLPAPVFLVDVAAEPAAHEAQVLPAAPDSG